ncbi:hypothetical protein THRCLA_10183 [Thraustotheca clavata]|uniref:CS domain-containing protein n=1 Tax=Thraustotheca clavata TaxID=74557 RepID=A0A1V9YSJ2_9STRA|nr:hypothetical protein THRCLA_10183 [Thraustotheca clavata]
MTKGTGAVRMLDDAMNTFCNEERQIAVDEAVILSREVDVKHHIGWTQTLSELYVYIPVRPRIVRKGVNILATEAPDKTHWLTIIVDTIPRAHVQLTERVVCRSLDWEIAPQKEASPFYQAAITIDPNCPQEVCATLVKEISKQWTSLYKNA